MVETSRTVRVLVETVGELKRRVNDLEKILAKVSINGDTFQIGQQVRVVRGIHSGCVGVIVHVMICFIDLRLDSRRVIRKRKENVQVV